MGIMTSLFLGCERPGQSLAGLRLDCWVAGPVWPLASSFHKLTGEGKKEQRIICNFQALGTEELMIVPFIRMGKCRTEGGGNLESGLGHGRAWGSPGSPGFPPHLLLVLELVLAGQKRHCVPEWAAADSSP